MSTFFNISLFSINEKKPPAQSTITLSLNFFAIFCNLFKSGTIPAKKTTIMHDILFFNFLLYNPPFLKYVSSFYVSFNLSKLIEKFLLSISKIHGI